MQLKIFCLAKHRYLEVFGNVVKSHTAISKGLQDALKKAVKPLKNFPEDQKDFRPSSDDKMLDLVHLSLFPVLYGKMRVLPDKGLGLESCFDYIGEAKSFPLPQIASLKSILVISQAEENYPIYRC